MRCLQLTIARPQTFDKTKPIMILAVLFGITWLAPRASAQWVWCSEIWHGPKTDVEWTIRQQGDAIVGKWTLETSHRILKGKIVGNSVVGDWVEEEKGGQTGTFVAAQSDNGRRMQTTFYYQGKQIESWEWFCGSGPTKPVVETQVLTPSPAEKPKPTPTLLTPRSAPNPILSQASLRGDGDHDTDNFKSFDTLPRVQQEKTLAKKGPRLPLENDMSDFSFRAFVKGGWPIVIDYGLESGAFAELTISVDGSKPLSLKIEPTKRNQVRITIPPDFGAKPQVAKLRITTLTDNSEPANFQLFGIAMGERGVQALQKMNALDSRFQVAMSDTASAPTQDGEPFHLSISDVPQSGLSIQIRVAPPTTIRPRQKPPLAFSVTSHSKFSNGRWELWQVDGFRWLEVWKKSTGKIPPDETKSGTWNGINSSKKVSLGNHAVQLTAWHGREIDRDWVIARTDPNLVVVK